MTERRSGRDRPPPPELEPALGDLGRRLSFPPTPDLAAAVHERLVSDATAARSAPWRPFSVRRLVIATVAAAVLLLAVLVAAWPAVRTAVADRLGLPGVVIRLLEREPTPEPSPVGLTLMLGRRVTLDQARAELPYPIQLPADDTLGPPDEVYLALHPADQMLTAVYRPRPGLPETAVAGVGALLSQFQGDVPDAGLIQKGIVRKGVGPTATLEVVSVNGHPGYWIEGGGHFFMYRDPAGEYREEEYRLAGNALLWVQDGLTFRLESELAKADALAVAASVRPVGG